MSSMTERSLLDVCQLVTWFRQVRDFKAQHFVDHYQDIHSSNLVLDYCLEPLSPFSVQYLRLRALTWHIQIVMLMTSWCSKQVGTQTQSFLTTILLYTSSWSSSIDVNRNSVCIAYHFFQMNAPSASRF